MSVYRYGVRRRDEQRADTAARHHLAPTGMKADHRAVVVERSIEIRREPPVDEDGSSRGVPNKKTAPVVAVQ